MKLKPYKKIAVLSLISAISFSANTLTFAESIPDIYRFIPSNTMLAFDVKTSEKAWIELSKNKSLQKFDPFSASGKKGNEYDFISDPEVKKNLGNNIVFALSELDLNSTNKARSDSGNNQVAAKEPPILLVAEMKNKSKHNYIKSKILKSFSKKSELAIIESAYKDAKIISILPKDPRNIKAKSSYFVFLNNYIMATNNVNSVQESVKSYYDPAMTIRNSANFTKSYSKLGTDYQIQLFLNLKKLASTFNSIKDPEITNALKTLKNQNIFMNDSMLVNLHLNDKSIELRTYTIPDKTNSSMQALLQKKTSTFQKYLNYVPNDSIAFMGFSDLNFKDYFEKVLPANQIETMGKTFRENFGINMNELYSNIKDETVIAAFNTPSNPLIPGFAIFMTPKDKEKMNSTIASLKIDLDVLEKNTQRGNRKQKLQNTSIPEKKGVMKFSEMKTYKDKKIIVTNEIPSMTQIGIHPAYTFIEDKLILTSNEEVMKTIIDRINVNAPDFTLEKNADFEKIIRMIGSKNNSLGFINLSPLISMIGSFSAGQPNSSEMVANLKKFHAIGFNSVNDNYGVLGKIIIIADLDQINFDKLLSPAGKGNVELNKNKATFY